MRQDKLIDALNFLDEDRVFEAMEVRDKKVKKRNFRYAGIAACLCLTMITGIYFLKDRESAGGAENGENKALTILGIFDKAASAGGGAVYLPDIENFDDGNPWEQGKIPETLPVFKNNEYFPAGEPVSGLSEEEMEKKLRDAAMVLGVEAGTIEREIVDLPAVYENYTFEKETTGETDRKYPSEEKLKNFDGLISLSIRENGLEISISRDGRFSITSIDGSETDCIAELPKEFFSDDGSSSDGQADLLLDFLVEEYGELFEFSNVKKISYIDTYINGETERVYEIYDGGKNYEEEIVNYGLGRARFAVSEGKLKGIYADGVLSCAEKVGDYPVISEEEAFEMLLRGEYIASYTPEKIKEEDVKKVEFEYSPGTESYLIPYYCFYVKDNSVYDAGDGHYILCMVPAIESKYIEGWPDMLKS